jgi:hypothetical protein
MRKIETAPELNYLHVFIFLAPALRVKIVQLAKGSLILIA